MKKVVGYNLKKAKSESSFHGSSMGLLHLGRQSSGMPEFRHLQGTFVGEVEPWARVWRLGFCFFSVPGMTLGKSSPPGPQFPLMQIGEE